jgi:hypothetical protein
MSVVWRVLLLGCVAVVAGTVIWMVASGRAESGWPMSWLGFLIVGGVLVTRLPRNRVGWCMLGIGVGLTTIVVGDLIPVPAQATVIGVPLAGAGFISIELFLLWYPTGRVVSPGWLKVQHAIVALGTVVVLYYLVRPGELDNQIDNPLGIGVLGGLRDGPIEQGAGFILAALGFVAFLSLGVRWRRADTVERQQLKWIIAGGLWFLLSFLVLFLFVDTGSSIESLAEISTFTVAFNAMAVGVGIAVLRYRLYDIDRVINRTVVYAVVVGLLGLVFVAGAVWLPSVLPFDNNNLAVAASTLAVFLLFNPLRQRVQRVVDRRFYRSRYDAQQVADEFSARLRDQVDPDAVAEDWMDVVQRTLQPASVAVWVREGS